MTINKDTVIVLFVVVMERIFKYIICLFFCVSAIDAIAQDDKRIYKNQSKAVNSSVSKLSKTLEDNGNDELLANDYVDVAKELMKTRDFVRAEDYLNRALEVYLKKKNRSLLAETYRELGKVQEVLGKKEAAAESFSKAAGFAVNETQKKLNRNDADRLRSGMDLFSRQNYIQQNLDLLNTPEAQKEKADAYQQMAQVKLEMNDNAGAIQEYQNALELEKDTVDAFRIKQRIANTLVTEAKFDEAIAMNESLLAEVQQTQKTDLAISQMQHLSDVYFQSNQPDRGFLALEDAYRLAVENGQTLVARNVLEQLVTYYERQRQTKQALSLYADFVGRLDTLVKKDSTLVDAQFLALHEEKISQLEKERLLKDELIARTNNYNHVLVYSIFLILTALILMTRMLVLNRKKSKKIALQSLRREMNPHFIFNSLNSVNQFIAQNKELEANKYLSSYSRLMRTIMEHSNKDFIPLSTEIEQMKEYLQLEHQRFQDKFTYMVEVDESLDTGHLIIPNMLIQPQLENAVWHGLRYRDGAGYLRLSFVPDGRWMVVTIEDDGIGLERSLQLKTKHQRTHQSRGMMNTNERIELLNRLYHTKISIEVIDKTGSESGVKVILRFPLRAPKTLS